MSADARPGRYLWAFVYVRNRCSWSYSHDTRACAAELHEVVSTVLGRLRRPTVAWPSAWLFSSMRVERD